MGMPPVENERTVRLSSVLRQRRRQSHVYV
jgi:hypothetical protein